MNVVLINIHEYLCKKKEKKKETNEAMKNIEKQQDTDKQKIISCSWIK